MIFLFWVAVSITVAAFSRAPPNPGRMDGLLTVSLVTSDVTVEGR